MLLPFLGFQFPCVEELRQTFRFNLLFQFRFSLLFSQARNPAMYIYIQVSFQKKFLLLEHACFLSSMIDVVACSLQYYMQIFLFDRCPIWLSLFFNVSPHVRFMNLFPRNPCLLSFFLIAYSFVYAIRLILIFHGSTWSPCSIAHACWNSVIERELDTVVGSVGTWNKS